MRMVYFGGTFNPPHKGHEFLIRKVLNLAQFDTVIAVPAHIPPHKGVENGVSPDDRLSMAKLAFEAIPGCSVDDIEIRRGGVSYTYDTIQELQGRYRVSGKVGIIIGYDLIPGLPTWKRWNKLKAIAHFIVARRNGEEADLSPLEGAEYTLLNNPSIDISSEMIRGKFSSGEPIHEYVSEPVLRYIEQRELYGPERGNSQGS